jgi:hypothetical protein
VQEKIPLKDRVRHYCITCIAHWMTRGPQRGFPEHWLPFPCEHSSGCGRSPSNGGQCCQCNDRRTTKLTIPGRTRIYCTPCAGRVRSLYDSNRFRDLPNSWHPIPRSCPHEQSCPCAESGICCNCRDGPNRQAWKSVSWKLAKLCKTCTGDKAWRSISRNEPAGGWIQKTEMAVIPLPPGMEDRGPKYEVVDKAPSLPEEDDTAYLDHDTRGISPHLPRIHLKRTELYQADPVPPPRGVMYDNGPTYDGPNLGVAPLLPTSSLPEEKSSPPQAQKRRKPAAQPPPSASLSRRRLPEVARLSSMADFHALEQQLRQ